MGRGTEKEKKNGTFSRQIVKQSRHLKIDNLLSWFASLSLDLSSSSFSRVFIQLIFGLSSLLLLLILFSGLFSLSDWLCVCVVCEHFWYVFSVSLIIFVFACVSVFGERSTQLNAFKINDKICFIVYFISMFNYLLIRNEENKSCKNTKSHLHLNEVN